MSKDTTQALLADYGLELLTLQDKYPHYETDPAARAAYDAEETYLKDLYAAKLARHVQAARVSELKGIRPPEQYKEYAKLMGSEVCTICGFNSEVFRKYLNDRIAALQAQPLTDKESV